MKSYFHLTTYSASPRGRLRWSAAVCAGLLAWTWAGVVCGAAAKVEVLNIRVGFDASLSSAKAANSFKIGTWTPVWVTLQGGAERFSGFMDVMVADTRDYSIHPVIDAGMKFPDPNPFTSHPPVDEIPQWAAHQHEGRG